MSYHNVKFLGHDYESTAHHVTVIAITKKRPSSEEGHIIYENMHFIRIVSLCVIPYHNWRGCSLHLTPSQNA